MLRRIAPCFYLLLALLLPYGGAAVAAGRIMAVTVDDLPFVRIDHFDEQTVQKQIVRLLDHLQRADITAVGFVNEQKLYLEQQLLPARIALLQQWLNGGMELGNHTYSHMSLNVADPITFKQDILRGEEHLRPLLTQNGMALKFFRYPYLHVGKTLQVRREVEAFLQDRHYTIAPVTVLSEEWIYAAAYDKALTDTAMREHIGNAYVAHMEKSLAYAEDLAELMFGRDIPQVLLIHANMLNADYLPAVIDVVKRRNYRFVSLDEAMQDRAYQALDTYTGAGGDSWLYHWLSSIGMFPDNGPHCEEFVRRSAGVNRYRPE